MFGLSFQLPPQIAGELFPTTMQAPAIERTEVFVDRRLHDRFIENARAADATGQPLVSGSETDPEGVWQALITALAEVSVRRHGPDIQGFVQAQRQNATLSIGEVFRKRLSLQDFEMDYSRAHGTETIAIRVTVHPDVRTTTTPKKQPEEKPPTEDLCLLVLYEGDKLAAIPMGALKHPEQPWSASYRIHYPAPRWADVRLRTCQMRVSKKYEYVYWPFTVTDGRLTQNSVHYVGLVNGMDTLSRCVASSLRYDFSPIMNGDENNIYTPLDRYKLTAAKIYRDDDGRNVAPAIVSDDHYTFNSSLRGSRSLPHCIGTDGAYYFSPGIVSNLVTLGVWDGVWNKALPEDMALQIADDYYFPVDGVAKLSTIFYGVDYGAGHQIVKEGCTAGPTSTVLWETDAWYLLWDYSVSPANYGGGIYFLIVDRTPVSTPTPVTYSVWTAEFDSLVHSGASVLTQEPVVKAEARLGLPVCCVTQLDGLDVTPVVARDAVSYAAHDMTTPALYGISSSIMHYPPDIPLGSISVPYNPHNTRVTFETGVQDLTTDRRDWSIVSFPYGRGSSIFWIEQDPNSDNGAGVAHTPYGDFPFDVDPSWGVSGSTFPSSYSSQSAWFSLFKIWPATAGYTDVTHYPVEILPFNGWLQISNGRHMIQAFTVTDNVGGWDVYIFCDDVDVADNLATLLGTTPDRINTMIMDVPLERIKQFT